MSTELTLPDLGEGIETATVVEIFVKPGDAVRVDQPLLSLETDKAQFELPATVGGTVERVLVKVGDDVAIGQPILAIAEGASVAARPAQQEPAADGGRKVVVEPAGRPVTAPAPAPPTARAAAAPPAPAGPEGPRAAGPSVARPAPPPASAPVAAAPSVRQLARRLGVRLEDVAAHAGTDRVTAADVEAFARAGGKATAGAPAVGSAAAEPLPDFSVWGEITVEEMSKIRRRTAENMARAWLEIPTVTHHDEADITKLDELRRRFAARAREAGGQLTWTAILLHVVAGALKRFPIFNASVDMANNRIIYKKYVHIGVAVDTERGLLVPVIRDADRKNIIELARALSEVSTAARNRNIRPEQMQGATFTITNLGGIGGVAFSPIINPPQVAILGVARSAVRPVWVDGKFEPRQILPLAVSYDHRVIDGADAARFMRWVCEALEEPFLLDLEGS